MYCNVVTAIDKIPTYLLRFNKYHWARPVQGNRRCMAQGQRWYYESAHQGTSWLMASSNVPWGVQRSSQDICGTAGDRISENLSVFTGVCWLGNDKLNELKKLKSDALFVIGRKATRTTPFPCPHQAVFVMFPSDAYTGWYSWPPVATDTIVLSLPAMIGTNIDPCSFLSWEIVS